MSHQARKTALNIIRLVVVLFLLAITMFPVFWIFVTAFKPDAEVLIQPPTVFPQNPTLEHIEAIFGPEGSYPYLVNSVIATVGSTILVLLITAPLAYVLARHRFVGNAGAGLSLSVLAARFIPGFMIVIPLFLIFRSWGLLDSVPGLILVYTVMNLPLVLWILLPALRAIPHDIFEAAEVDGASVWRGFISVGLPLMKPAMATAATLSMIFAWNEFFTALIFTQTKAQTAPLMISKFLSDFGVQYGFLAANALVVALPMIILGIVAQRHLVRGMTAGAVK